MSERRSAYFRILKQSGTYSIAVFADRLAAVILVPLLTRALSPSDYGVMELLDLTMGLVGLVGGVRLGQAVAYYYAGAKDSRERAEYLSTAVVAMLSVGASIGMLAMWGGPWLSDIVFHNPDHYTQFRILAISLALSLPLETALAYVRCTGRAWIYTLVSLMRLAVTVTLTLVLVVWLRQGISGWLYSSLFSAIATAAVALAITVKETGISLHWRALKDLAMYAMPLNIGSVAMFFIHFGDRWFLRNAVSLADIGIYGLAYKIGMLIAYVQIPFSVFWTAQVFSLVRQSDGEILYSRVATYFLLSLSAAAVALAAFERLIIDLTLPAAYRSVADYVPWIALAYVIRAFGEFVRSVFLIEKRPDVEAWISSAGAVTALLGYMFLIPRFHLWGAIIATGFTFVVMLILSIHYGQALRQFAFEWRRLSLIGLWTVVFCTIPTIVRVERLWMEAALAVGVTLGFAAALLLTRFASPAEIGFVKVLSLRVLRHQLAEGHAADAHVG